MEMIGTYARTVTLPIFDILPTRILFCQLINIKKNFFDFNNLHVKMPSFVYLIIFLMNCLPKIIRYLKSNLMC